MCSTCFLAKRATRVRPTGARSVPRCFPECENPFSPARRRHPPATQTLISKSFKAEERVRHALWRCQRTAFHPRSPIQASVYLPECENPFSPARMRRPPAPHSLIFKSFEADECVRHAFWRSEPRQFLPRRPIQASVFLPECENPFSPARMHHPPATNTLIPKSFENDECVFHVFWRSEPNEFLPWSPIHASVFLPECENPFSPARMRRPPRRSL